jgi:hypothetical protein
MRGGLVLGSLEGQLKGWFGEAAAGNIRYAESISSRITIDVNVPVGSRVGVDLKRFPGTSTRSGQLIRQKAHAEANELLLAHVNTETVEIYDYTKGFTKKELKEISEAATTIRTERIMTKFARLIE